MQLVGREMGRGPGAGEQRGSLARKPQLLFRTDDRMPGAGAALNPQLISKCGYTGVPCSDTSLSCSQRSHFRLGWGRGEGGSPLAGREKEEREG